MFLLTFLSLYLCFEFLAVIRTVGNKDVLIAGYPRWRFSSFCYHMRYLK